MTRSVPPLSLPGWCLVRVPILPAVPHDAPSPRHDQLSRRLLDLAIEYADTFRRHGDDDPEHDNHDWQDRPTRLATYGNRARFRSTPFGLFSFNLLADVADLADGAPVPRLDLTTEVRLHRFALPKPTGTWFVNPTLAKDAGRWSYVRPGKGGTTVLSEKAAFVRLAELLAGLRAAAPRSAQEWTAELGEDGAAQFDLCTQQDLLLPEHAPAILVEPAATATPAAPVKAALADARPFRADEFVDSFSEVRARLPRSQVTALVDGAVEVMRTRWLSERLGGVRDHVAGAYTGGAVPLNWLLAAPADHPLGSWRRPPAPETALPPAPGRRLFVPRERRDNAAVEWWSGTFTLDEWRTVQGDVPGTQLREVAQEDGPRFGMVCGALLSERCSGADSWLKLIAPNFWAGPGARLGEQLDMPGLDAGCVDPEALSVELGWLPPEGLAPLARRTPGVSRRLNLNMPHRMGDLCLADLAVAVVDGRLQLLHRRDGRHVELRWDSPVALTLPRHPWVVQLLGLLMGEANGTGQPDPSMWQPPGGMTPRITAGRCLIARRSLVLDPRQRADLLELAADPGRLCDVLTEVGLGPRIEVTEGPDLTMRLDLTDSDQRAWLIRRLRRETRLRLHEALPVSTPVQSELGGHVHDLWVPWTRPGAKPSRPLSPTRIVARPPAEDPGWTSWYVYAPDLVVEGWLTRPDIAAMMHRGELFYIRYRDERPHLRVRVRTPLATDALLAGLRAHLAATVSQQPYEIVTHPYMPEDHRYGGPAVRAETLRHFCADSAWWAERLAARAGLTERYVLAATRIAVWCRQLAGDDGALDLLCELRGLDPRLPSPKSQREWTANFRSARADLEQALDRALTETDPTLDHLAGMDDDARQLTLTSVIHMSVNRGLPVGLAVGREPEIVLAAARLLKGRMVRAPRKVSVHA